MARRLLFILFTFFCCSIKSQTVHFSIQAHQDDWQLFMSSRIIADMTVANTKMVFITLTAGDESCGTCSYGNGPFYLGREIGAVYSSKFAADLTTGTTPLDVPVVSAVTITATTSPFGSHTVWKYTYKNTVNYFLRLPDGDVGGAGFGNNNNQSLEKLKSGAIPAINVIGNSITPATNGPAALTYTWSQLTATIRQIINDEKVTGTQSWIHTAYTITGAQTAYNANDHSDHRYASVAAQEAVSSGMAWVGVNGFMDYNSSSLSSPLLSNTDIENASILFGLETFGMTEKEYQNEFASSHQLWLPIDFFQVIKTPSGNAPIARDNPPEARLAPSYNDESLLTKIPMVISVNSHAFIDKDLNFSISPYEPGELNTSIYDMAGKKIYDMNTKVENRNALVVTLKSPIKTKGAYLLKNILNNKFIETRKIIVAE